MDDRKLTTLLAAVEHGSLSKAAASLGLTQAGVTQMMNEINKCLNLFPYGTGHHNSQLSFQLWL